MGTDAGAHSVTAMLPNSGAMVRRLDQLVAGVLAHSYFFGDHSFAWVLLAGTLGGTASDNVAYLSGRNRSSRLSQ